MTIRILIHGLALAAVFAGAPGCGDADDTAEPMEEWSTTPGPLMRPGDNCLRCHNPKGGVGAPTWSAGGTVYASPTADRNDGLQGVHVFLTDAKGKVVELITNDAGNFFTAEPLVTPFRVRLEHEDVSIEMPDSPPAGSCNACHSNPPVGGAPGRVTGPMTAAMTED